MSSEPGRVIGESGLVEQNGHPQGAVAEQTLVDQFSIERVELGAADQFELDVLNGGVT
jgi:hypothetical protein